MPYNHHVFISYRRAWIDEFDRVRDDLVETWVHKFFEPELQRRLTQALGGERSYIFLDSVNIRGGEEWEQSLVRALRRSCCLVAVCSPDYFQSKWCVAEWLSFAGRANGLVVPAVFQRYDGMPGGARRIQQRRDYTGFRTTSENFPNWPKYGEFEQRVERFARDVAEAVDRAPAYCDTHTVYAPGDSTAVALEHVEAVEQAAEYERLFVSQRRRVSRADVRLAA